MWEGDHESDDSARIREVEGVGAVELVRVGRLLRMDSDFFLMPLCGSVGGGEFLKEQNGLPWEHSVENQWGREDRDRKPNSVEGRGESEEAETESLILWLVVLELLAGGWW